MERKIFECSVGGRDLSLIVGNCVAVMFRQCVEVDYLAVSIEEDGEEATLRVFNNPEMVRWMAGYRLKQEADNFKRPQVLSFQDTQDSFRELTGWNPAVVEKEEPSDEEMEWFLDVNTSNLDQEWKEL